MLEKHTFLPEALMIPVSGKEVCIRTHEISQYVVARMPFLAARPN